MKNGEKIKPRKVYNKDFRRTQPSFISYSDEVQLLLESVDRTKEFSNTPTQLVQLKPAETRKKEYLQFQILN